MATKLDMLRAFAAAGDWRAALRIASKFQELGTHKDAILRAWLALQHPSFCREINVDPDAAVKAGIEALKDRYSL